MNTPFADVESFRLAYSLRHPEDWSRIIGTLAERRDRAALEGLIELLHRPPSAKAAIAAIGALETHETLSVLDALYHALKSPHVFVRHAAVRSLQSRKAFAFSPVVSRMLAQDPSWLIRRAAVNFLANDKTEFRWDILKARTDPHWRVRHALIRALMNWSEIDRREIQNRLAAETDLRTRGLLKYLEYRQTGKPPEPLDLDLENPADWCEFWDWDPAVLAWRLEQMPPAERREKISLMPRLIGHDEERVRRWAAAPLQRDGDVAELQETLGVLDDPRHPAFETVLKLAERLDWDRREQLARTVFHLEQPSPGQWAWAIDQIGDAVDEDDVSPFEELCQRAGREVPLVRAALARMLSRVHHALSAEMLASLLKDSHPDVVLAALEGIAERFESQPFFVELSEADWQRLLASDDPEIRAAAARVVLCHDVAQTFLPGLVADSFSMVRMHVAEWLVKQNDSLQEQWLAPLQQEESSMVRAAALTSSRAEELMQQPARETSWLVLEHAARKCKTPLWKISPEALPVEVAGVSSNIVPLSLEPRTDFATRRLADRQVSPLGVSGHYGLPVEGFVNAMEAGINLMFWEPNYHTLTDFMGRLPHRERNRIHMVVGTFEASPARIRNDVERALEKLRIEQVAVFLLFWTRSWNRITDPVREMLDQLKRAGKIGNYGLSTHSRPLAVEAIEAGWNPVMVRHSAAHRGAETMIFPKALERGTSLLTFNNTCYGRILKAFPAGSQLSPADCYRFTLSFEAVTACWSAPGTVDELETNLAALWSPDLPAGRREQLCDLGRTVYEEDTIFRQLVRGV